MHDLVVLVADNNMKATASALINRPWSLRIRPVSHRIFVHVNKDPGCLRESADFLRSFVSQFRHALAMFDRDGCGRESVPPTKLEEETETSLASSGWDRSAVATIVLDPELEVWVWVNSPHVASALGWPGGLAEM